jgi:hypothetical protein
MGLSFTIAAGPSQRSHSRVRVPRDSWTYFTVSDSRLPQTGGPGPRVYIPQEEDGPVIPPGTLGSACWAGLILPFEMCMCRYLVLILVSDYRRQYV